MKVRFELSLDEAHALRRAASATLEQCETSDALFSDPGQRRCADDAFWTLWEAIRDSVQSAVAARGGAGEDVAPGKVLSS